MPISRLKTGQVPPSDFTFEELGPGLGEKESRSGSGQGRAGNLEKRNSLIRTWSKQSLVKEKSAHTVNYYQLKRELEKNVEAVESEVARGQKEMRSLQVMVATYRTNPKFGDVAQFEVELQSVTLRVQHSQAQVHSLARG